METLTVAAELEAHLKELHLPTLRDNYADAARQATQETLSYEQFLLELVRGEVEVRTQHRIERRLRESRLPLEKSLEAFELPRLPLPVKQQFAALLDGGFLERREN